MEPLDARAIERRELLAVNRKVLLAMLLAVGPSIQVSYAYQLLDRPAWQFVVLTLVFFLVWMSWGYAARANRAGRLETAVLIPAYSLLLFDATAMALRQGIFGGVLLTNVCLLIYVAVFAPRHLVGASVFAAASSMALRGLEAWGRLPAAQPTPLLAVTFDLTIIACALPVTVYFLRQKQRISELPHAALQATAAQQQRLLEMVSGLQPQIEEFVRRGEETARAVATQATEQAVTAEEVRRAMERVQAALVEAAQASRTTRDAAGSASEQARQCSVQVATTAGAMDRFGELLGSVRASMQQLSDQSERTEEVIGLLQEVNEQLEMLAINAALEAARAGDAGRGFAVVAGELRRMLSANGERFARGKELLGTIRVEATRTLEKAEGVVAQLSGHVAALGQTGDTLRQLDSRFAETTSRVVAIAEASDGHHAEVERVARIMRELQESSGELTRSAQGLSEAMGRLVEGQREVSALVGARAAG